MLRRQLGFESLEPRSMLSGDYSLAHFVASDLAHPVSHVPAIVALSTPPTAGSMVAIDSETSQAPSSSDDRARWDWLADTYWYVPAENLLAYSASQDLADPQPIADQTLWRITQAVNGQFAGEAITKLSLYPLPTSIPFTGIVTPSGQIRMEFESTSTITGIGQTRFVNGAWQIEMQMATETESLVTHWAYMAERQNNEAPPEPSTLPPEGSPASNEWRWLEGTEWAISDTALFGSSVSGGVFAITSFRSGYFWGSGTSGEPFNVLGSVTPEGNVLLAVSVGGEEPAFRTGLIERTSAESGQMALRSYDGSQTIGTAWTLQASQRLFLASVQELISQ